MSPLHDAAVLADDGALHTTNDNARLAPGAVVKMQVADSRANSIADHARQYTASGLVLVPIPAASKAPKAKGWNERHSCWASPEDVPIDYQGNVGLAHAYSRTCALDIDNYGRACEALAAQGIDLPALLAAEDAVQVRSGREGRAKLIYKLPDGVDPLPSVDRNDAGEGYELRCGTKSGLTVQDVLPPSVHPDTGQPYQWVGDPRRIPVLPEPLLALWCRHLMPKARTSSVVDAPRPPIEEGRHADVLKLAARVARMVVDDALSDEAGMALLKAEQERGRWSRDVTDELRRAYRDALAKLRSGAWLTPECRTSAEFAPEPLRRSLAPAAPFPLDELGPILGSAARAMRRVIQAPDAICGSSVLAAASLAAQGLADVHLDGRVYPTSLWILSVAESGERKSATDSEAMRAAGDYEQELTRQHAIDEEIHVAQLAEWEMRREQAKKAAAKQRGEGLAGMLMEIGPAPLAPMQPKVTVADFTAEGIAKLLMVGRPSIGAFTAEAALVFGGHGMTKETVARTAATLCKLWDNGSADRIRAGEGATKLYGRRLAIHLLAQPVIAERALADEVLSGQGFLARCLLSWPEGTAGDRVYVTENLRDDPAMECLRQRLLMLHREPVRTSDHDPRELSPRALQLEPSAADLWRQLHDSVEAGMRQGGSYSQVKPWASKTPEQALRIAGVLAMVEDPYADAITKKVMDRGAELALWHLGEAVRLRSVAETSVEIRDAEALLDWCHQTSRTLLHSRDALQRGPNRIRNRVQFLKSMAVLEDAGWARRDPDGTVVEGAPRKNVWRIASKAV